METHRWPYRCYIVVGIDAPNLGPRLELRVRRPCPRHEGRAGACGVDAAAHDGRLPCALRRVRRLAHSSVKDVLPSDIAKGLSKLVCTLLRYLLSLDQRDLNRLLAFWAGNALHVEVRVLLPCIHAVLKHHKEVGLPCRLVHRTRHAGEVPQAPCDVERGGVFEVRGQDLGRDREVPNAAWALHKLRYDPVRVADNVLEPQEMVESNCLPQDVDELGREGRGECPLVALLRLVGWIPVDVE
mmetsp:Transcript_40397/g.99210  ORF Transcript_40397/g.99210 Transcript_40397/m.99210 type:complete len:241 (-) Transcript_40397:640-1362(-)